jgi:hypothetical protein
MVKLLSLAAVGIVGFILYKELKKDVSAALPSLPSAAEVGDAAKDITSGAISTVSEVGTGIVEAMNESTTFQYLRDLGRAIRGYETEGREMLPVINTVGTGTAADVIAAIQEQFPGYVNPEVGGSSPDLAPKVKQYLEQLEKSRTAKLLQIPAQIAKRAADLQLARIGQDYKYIYKPVVSATAAGLGAIFS